MTKTLIKTLAILAMLGLVACGESVADLDADPDAVAESVEAEISRLGDEIDVSGVEGELAAAWNNLETSLASAVENVRSGEALDTEAIESEVEEFQNELEASEAADTVRDAWSTLRVQIDQMLARLG